MRRGIAHQIPIAVLVLAIVTFHEAHAAFVVSPTTENRDYLEALGCINVTASDAPLSSTAFIVRTKTFAGISLLYECPQAKAEEIKKHFLTEETSAARTAFNMVSPILVGLLYIIISILLWLLELVSIVLGPLILVQQFITHGFVTNGWVFIQGFANLGFLLALLFIAAAKVLRIDIGGGVRRLLPRLLIGALLINFSLVIGGLIIDTSRVLMAAITGPIAINPRNIANEILAKANVDRESYDIVRRVGDGGNAEFDFAVKGSVSNFDTALVLMKMTMVLTVMLGAMLAITAGMFIRYVALLLLLVISPLPYLFIAIPSAAKYASAWWRSFLSYTFYGPIVLFVLVLIAKVGGKDLVDAIPLNLPDGVLKTFLNQTLNLIIVSTLLILAATTGKKLGLYGANATVNFLSRQGRRVASAAGTGLYVGSGTRFAARQVGDAGKTVKDQFVGAARSGRILGKVGQFFAGARRDASGRLRPGEDSLGAKIGKAFSPYKTQAAKELSQAPQANAADLIDVAYNPSNLVKGSTREALSNKQIEIILSNPAIDPRTQQQKRLLLSDTNIVRKIGDSEKASLLSNPNYADQLLRALREIDRLDNPPRT